MKEKKKNYVIVNADDFGLLKNCTYAIAEAFDKGLVSSTTACGNGEYVELAAKLAKEKNFIDRVGIHINLYYGKPLTKEISLDPFFCEDGLFHCEIDRRKKLSPRQIREVKEEVVAQVERLRELGFPLTHADSHHHVHMAMNFKDLIQDIVKELGIYKIRIHRNVGNIPFYKKLVKNLYNKELEKRGLLSCRYFGSAEDYLGSREKLDNGICEVMVHPDYNSQGELIDRFDEVDGFAVGEPLEKITALLEGRELVSYEEVK